MTMQATVGGKNLDIFVPYTRPLLSAKDIRPLVAEMHHEAFASLGPLYKLQHGYYKAQALNTLESLGLRKHHGGATARGQLALGVVAAGAIGLGALLVTRRRSSKD